MFLIGKVIDLSHTTPQKTQGKTVIFVKDVPGFYVNRCLGPYLVETSALIEVSQSMNRSFPNPFLRCKLI
jgi:3-hydroxyacyl-CoA dehydrogenase